MFLSIRTIIFYIPIACVSVYLYICVYIYIDIYSYTHQMELSKMKVVFFCLDERYKYITLTFPYLLQQMQGHDFKSR